MDQKDFETDITESLDILKKGGLILYPTDTVWGIGCDATNPVAVEKIYLLKRRSSAQSMIVLLADIRDLNIYTGHLHPYMSEYLEKTTSPTTVIYDGAIGVAENLVHADGTIAIRIISENFCRHLIKRFKKPLVSTSANISGDNTAANFKQISQAIIDGVDYVVKYRQSDEHLGVPSTLVRFNNQGQVEVLRAGK
jgi:L-threonylcarbamoyladenylate synthase